MEDNKDGIMIDGVFHHLIEDGLGTCPNNCSMKEICEREDMSVCAIWDDEKYHFETKEKNVT